MRLTYDASVNAAYLYILDPIARGGVAESVPLENLDDRQPDEPDLEGINLDFDADGRLVGIEFLSPTRQLPAAVLEHAERHD
jgi:uncharacterized protein YuzE